MTLPNLYPLPLLVRAIPAAPKAQVTTPVSINVSTITVSYAEEIWKVGGGGKGGEEVGVGVGGGEEVDDDEEDILF